MKDKTNTKASFLNTIKELFIVGSLQFIAFIPPILFFMYANVLKAWWLILFFLYCLIFVVIIYSIFRYREIVELRGYFTKEEFEKRFSKELKFIKIMDYFSKYFVN